MSKLQIYPAIEPTIKLLDKINLSSLFIHNMTPDELMDKIEDYVEHEDKNLYYIIWDDQYDYFKGDVFNWLGTDEFMNYVEDNYGVRWEEYIEYRLK